MSVPTAGTQVAEAGTCLAAGTAAPGRYCVRAGEPADAAAIRMFVAGLSVQTQYLRFFTAVSPPSPSLLRMLSGGQAGTDILVIFDESGAITGHGMAVDVTTGEAAVGGRPGVDIGLVVADSWQGQGLGTTLLGLLVARAAARGIRALQVEVLPGNSRMLALIDRNWPLARRTWNGDAISITADISAGRRGASATHREGGSREPGRSAA
jgi:GNAT superfamily N-acetyltransferase